MDPNATGHSTWTHRARRWLWVAAPLVAIALLLRSARERG
jgi:hypothetical protein